MAGRPPLPRQPNCGRGEESHESLGQDVGRAIFSISVLKLTHFRPGFIRLRPSSSRRPCRIRLRQHGPELAHTHTHQCCYALRPSAPATKVPTSWACFICKGLLHPSIPALAATCNACRPLDCCDPGRQAAPYGLGPELAYCGSQDPLFMLLKQLSNSRKHACNVTFVGFGLSLVESALPGATNTTLRSRFFVGNRRVVEK